MMPLHYSWDWHHIQTASHIYIKHIQRVCAHWYAVNGHTVTASLHQYWPSWLRFRNSSAGSLAESTWWHYIIVEAAILFKLLPTYILDIYNKVFEPLVCCLKSIGMGAPLYHSTSHWPQILDPSGSHEDSKWCHYILFDADIHLRPLYTSILDIFKVFEPLVCCLKEGIWVHPCTISPAKLTQMWEFWGLLAEWKCCHYTMVEAVIILFKLLPPSILDIYKVSEHIDMLSIGMG